MVITCIILVIVGFGIGILSGLLGVGGGTLLVPIFNIGLNMSGVSATATSLFTIIPTSISGMVSHIRGKTCVPKVGFSMGIGGAIASPIGVQLAIGSPEWLVIAAVAVVIAYSAITSLSKALKMGKPDSGQVSAQAKEAAPAAPPSPEDIPFTPTLFAKSVAIGLVSGVAAGYVGLGGGFIMVPLMSMLLNFPMRLASGTSLIAIMCIAIPGSITQAMLGNIDFLAGIMIACGTIPGAFLGGRLIKRFEDRTLRFIFAGFLGVAAILLVVKQFM